MGASIDGYKKWWHKSDVKETERHKLRLEQAMSQNMADEPSDPIKERIAIKFGK